MHNTYYDDYDKKFPELVLDILEYFDLSNNINGNIKDKSVLKFCMQHLSNGEPIYQPTIVNRICKRLCDCSHLECVCVKGVNGWDSNYIFLARNRELFKSERNRLKYYYNSMVYGFDYIYDLYKSIVVPLVWEKENGDYSAGTGFKFLNGIVTAKHCIEDVKNLQIKGYKADELQDKPIYISDNDGVDIAFIETGRIEEPLIYTDKADVMQEVLVMGYPKIPAFTNFLTAEKATISSKADSRITPTVGAIAAFGNEYLAKIEAMLITARIRGGNSGGPVINSYGCLVGIACHIPDVSSENGEYDDLGYGVAVPVEYLIDIVKRKPRKLDVPTNFFRDYIECQ